MSDVNKSTSEIKDFTEFLEKCLGRKVLTYALYPLTKPGDNYGSIMLSVKVKVTKTESEGIDELNLVAKTAITNPFLVSIFQPDVTFVKEAHFYSDIIVALEHFEQTSNVPDDERINAFIKCIGSRLSLDPNVKVADADAVLLFENIKMLGYKNIDQRIGFDTDESLAIIKQLAKFHSLCIAMRRQHGDLFETKIEQFLAPVHKIINNEKPKLIDVIIEGVQFVNLDPKLRVAVEKQLRICFAIMTDERSMLPDTPYNTIIHKDFWSTNLMIKKDDDSTQIKIYDFQMYCLGSFAFDLVLFLFTSVSPSALSENFNLFINHYHKEFVKMLEFVGCPLDGFEFKKMWKEIQDQMKSRLLYILYMNKIISIQSDAPSSYDEVSHDTFLGCKEPSKDTLNRWKFIIDFFNENDLI